MKNTTIRIGLGFATLFAASAVLAEESVDCFYEANHGHALCQMDQRAKSMPLPAKEFTALQASSEESIDCFYEANRWNTVCAAAPERIVLHDRVK